MSKEAMKLALEAAEVLETLFKQAEAMHEEVTAGVNVHCQITVADLRKGLYAAAAIREALAEQETVLPGGGHVPAVPVAVYGYCPECGGAGVMRERRPNGDDKCTNGHKYPSSKALAEQPAQRKPLTDATWIWFWLMDWCKRNGTAPAKCNSLFAMVSDARAIEAAHGVKE